MVYEDNHSDLDRLEIDNEELPVESTVKHPVGHPCKERQDQDPQEPPEKRKCIGRPTAKPLFKPSLDVYKHNGKIVSLCAYSNFGAHLLVLFLGCTRNPKCTHAQPAGRCSSISGKYSTRSNEQNSHSDVKG